MGSFLKEMFMKSFCCVNSTFHIQASFWAQGRKYSFSREAMMLPSLALRADSRANRDVQIISRGPGSSRLDLPTLQGQARPRADPAQPGNCPLSSTLPGNLILSGLYFRSGEEDLRVAHII